jgi:hypothetical protein
MFRKHDQISNKRAIESAFSRSYSQAQEKIKATRMKKLRKDLRI